MEDKIDVHHRDLNYQRAMEKLEANTSMNPKDKELILKFVWDCKLGKTKTGKRNKKVGKARIMKYVMNLRSLSRWVGKPFDEVEQKDMEKLVLGIEEDVHKNREKKYSDETKVDFKKTLRKFYAWLGKPKMVEFIDLTVEPKDVPALRREEVERMINSTPDLSLKAGIMVLFDGGLRIEEFLNLRIKDVTNEKYGEDSDCYWIDIRYSKTFARKIPLPLSTEHLRNLLEVDSTRKNPDTPIFPCTYCSFRKRLKTLAKKVLNKNVYPHMLRHSSATYWAPKMNRYQICTKYGWSFGSNMPDRYIKRKGIIFNEIAEKGDVDRASKLQKENVDLKEQMERLEHNHKKFTKALEFLMPAVMEKMDEEDFINSQVEMIKKRILKMRSAN